MSPNVANVVMVPIGWLIWYRKISVLEMIKIIVIRGKFLVGFSSLRGIIKGRGPVYGYYCDKMQNQYDYREPFK